MAVPSTTSSVIVGSGWFCALLVLGVISADSSATKSAHRRRATTEQPEPRTERPAPTHDERPPEFVARRPEFPPEPVDSVETHTPAATPTHSVLPTAQPGPALPAAEPAMNETTVRSRAVVPQTSPRPAAPIPTPGTLSVSVAEPSPAVVADPVQFVVAVQNSSESTAYGLTVTARFGDEWEFPGSDEHSTMLRLGELPPGGQRQVSLSLIPLQAGPQKVEFEIASESHERQLLTAEARIGQRLVDFQIAGPERRWAGQRAEYIVSLSNISGHELPDARVEIAFDPAVLVLREASSGVIARPGALAWALGPLLIGERVLIQFECECASESIASPLQVRFSTEESTIAQSRLQLDVLPPSPVEVSIVDTADPWTVGSQSRFLITVRNRSPQMIDDLSLRFSTSPHLEQLSVVPESASSRSEAATDAFGVSLRAGRLPPQSELRYIATASTVLSGDALLRVLVQTKAVPAPFEYAESALIVPAE